MVAYSKGRIMESMVRGEAQSVTKGVMAVMNAVRAEGHLRLSQESGDL